MSDGAYQPAHEVVRVRKCKVGKRVLVTTTAMRRDALEQS